jgi:hypothetical protein
MASGCHALTDWGELASGSLTAMAPSFLSGVKNA